MIVSQNYLRIFSLLLLSSHADVQSSRLKKKISNFLVCQLVSCVLGYSRIRNCFCWLFWLVSQYYSNVLWHVWAYAPNQSQPNGLENYFCRCACLWECVVRTWNLKVLFSDRCVCLWECIVRTWNVKVLFSASFSAKRKISWVEVQCVRVEWVLVMS